MSQDKIDILQRALQREKKARKFAEKILEQKSSELYELTQELKKSNLQLEKAINYKNSELQGVFENIVDAYVVIDLWGDVLKMNTAAIDMLGYDSESEDVNLLKLVHPEEEDKAAASFQKLFKEGAITNFQIKIRTKEKVTKLVHINASMIYDDGVAVAAQGIVRDITLENQYQKSIEAERQKYSNIIANMNLGLIEVDTNDVILMVNQSFTEISGYSEDELIGKKGKDLFPIDTDVEVITDENNKRVKGQSNSYELRVKNKEGDIRHWLISGAPNYNLKGEIVGSIGIHLDITALKKLQLQKENLLKELESSNNELEEYAHIVSHDLKSPLRSINALVNWIKEDNAGKLNDTTLKHFGLIDTTLEKMEHLITDILNYSSVGVNENEKVSVPLNTTINELIKIMLVPENIDIKIPETLPNITGDKTKLQQLFQNLISNAIKFIDKPKGLITIKTKDLGTHHQFSIQDNGIGIEKHFHDKIFKIFHSLNKSKDSTGIGLSIVKKIVELHHGNIWLESTPNVGSTFYFTLKK